MIDSIVLCIFAALYNSFTGKPYPTRPSLEVAPIAKSEVDKNAELNARLNAILDEYQEVLDVDRAELVKIIKLASKPKEM
jgi:CBS domain-containing membrane protein